MRWTPGGVSGDIEDRRASGGGPIRGTHLGIGATLLLVLLSIIFKRDFVSMFSGSEETVPAVNQASRSVQDPAEANLVQFVSFVLDDTQKTWDSLLPQQSGVPYRHAKLVLFRDVTDSSCGLAQSATGPFYCPADEKVYIDLGFYDELTNRFGAPGEFAQAYVLAHEIGHHVQKVLGISGKVRALPHFGERSEQRILHALAFAETTQGRRLLADVLPVVEALAAALRRVPGVREVAVAGSLRRRRETVGDADLLAVAARPGRVMEAFLALRGVSRVLGRGDTKSTVVLDTGLQVDLRVVPVESFGAALAYFTGSKAHNVALRQLALKRKLKLNEYGLFRGTRRIAGRTEQDVYAALGLAWIPAELREDQGELAAARDGTLPALIEPGDLRGDLQLQTDWTDGADSIDAMARAAREQGFEYIAITDHTRGLAMAGGADETKLRRQMREIARLDRTLDGIRVLSGAEVNITRDGGLDVADETLAALDVVGIAVHSHLGLPRVEQTARIVRAMRNPHADILFHPTNRLLQRREASDVDMDAIIAAACETGTALELDAYPDRLDLRDEHLRRAAAAGVRIVIDSDAHSTRHLTFAREHGVPQARRAWLTAGDVLNTRPVAAFLAALKGGRARRADGRRRTRA